MRSELKYITKNVFGGLKWRGGETYASPVGVRLDWSKARGVLGAGARLLS